MKQWIKKMAQFGGLISLLSCSQPTDVITIDLSQEGAEIPSSLYGIFFEEITHSGDGGLYAEMIRNRGFEDGTLPSGTVLQEGRAVAKPLHCYSNDSINHWSVEWSESLFMEGWEVKCISNAKAPSYQITENQPLNSATPHSLFINLDEAETDVLVINTGYWGIAVTEGQTYNFQFHLLTKDLENALVKAILLDSKDQVVTSKEFQTKRNGLWNCYEGSFVSNTTANDLRFALLLPHKGKVYIDFVSMFPENTFRGHKNGLREDVAGMLEALQPDFVRWPGGCIVEGLTMDNRIKWKETIGDITKRPGEYNLWGYRSTYGFGYHEFLQFCEDINAEGMFVCNAGMSCLFRNGDYWKEEAQIDGLIQEALDAIEYALGDTTTIYGKKRAANGHAQPFPLKYVEVGNENIGLRYAKNYNRFYKAIKEKYPQIEVICALMFSPHIQDTDTIEVLDPHYYETAGWFYNNAYVYDKLPDNLPYKIYVGEYAAIGRPSLYSSLAEAAYLTGVERNADKVQMVSYAPLLQNAAHGRDHLLVLKNDSIYGRTNYYVLKMFSENRPDVNLSTDWKRAFPEPTFRTKGFIGLGTNNADVQFKDLKITVSNEETYASEWDDFADNWNVIRGDWQVKENVLYQNQKGIDAFAILKDKIYEDCTIELKAKKISGTEGFRVVFGGSDLNNYFMADMGSHTNESVIFREINNEGSISLFDYRNTTSIKANQWYTIRIEIKGDHWKCYLNDKLEYEYTYTPEKKHYVVSGYDRKRSEIIVKLINAEAEDWNVQLQLDNAKEITSKGTKIVLGADDRFAENSFSAPFKVVPEVSELSGIASTFKVDCKANSLTILRIACKK